MHLLQTQERSLDDEAAAIDLAQSPAELVVLSFTESDLAVTAGAYEGLGGAGMPRLRLANLGRLKHPYSVDLFVERLLNHARFVLVRLLGGLDYWRYGVDELAAAARRGGFHLAIVAGDGRADTRLDKASTLPSEDLLRLWRCYAEGGAANVAQALRFMASRSDFDVSWAEPQPVPEAGLFEAGCRGGRDGGGHALVLFYRSALLAADTAPMAALADALAARGLAVTSAAVTSLKDPAAQAWLGGWLADNTPDAIVNTTAFSARSGENGSVLDAADCPVLQAFLAGSSREVWAALSRGLAAADLAMNIVLPELDGRIIAGALSFKAEADHHADLEFIRTVHRPEPDRIDHVADLAAAWVRLRRTPRAERRLALVVSDYPGREGRTGYAVGLDTPASLVRIADHLRSAGFAIDTLPAAADLMHRLVEGDVVPVLSLADYARLLAGLPAPFVARVDSAWGSPAADPVLRDGGFAFRWHRAGQMILAVQPDRGAPQDRKSDYHDATVPPRHAYIAFYLWLREIERIDAMIHLGTHGTLEWLPGKAVALSDACSPHAVLGPVPVVYPFIVNNPGEAAQAKRRIAAVTVGHLTPPLREAGAHGAVLDLEALFDEYAQAQVLDSRRAKLLAGAILDKARESGIADDSGIADEHDPEAALARLDAWLCDIKEMRIGNGLHVFGTDTDAGACGDAEREGLLAALDGRFVAPGPSGAPARGRPDVLPTGRNLFSIDPRSIPTRTAWTLGRRLAAEVMTRHAQDHGEWPRRLVLDLWGSATMRTGGDDLAQGLALMGVRPRWDEATGRVLGYDILPLAALDWPRVDVTLRISGLFRDTFPDQIALFDAASRAVAALEEADAENALAADRRASPASVLAPRIFGAAPGRFGIGLDRLSAESREALGALYLDATSHAYGSGEGVEAPEAFRARVAEADAYVHVQDLPGTDLLDAAAYPDHEGGFAAAAAMLGSVPALYHADSSVPGRTVVRSLPEEIARVVRGRATNPRWILGQMRHGHRGAAEIAETVDNLFLFAASTEAVPSRHFDLLFEATCGSDEVRAFLLGANPPAARAIARRFLQARERAFWTSRSNSAAAILAGMLEAET